MARINRSDVIQKAVNDLAISTSVDKIPNETLDKVQLTYDLNRNFSSFILSTSATSTGSLSVTLPSVSAGAETYITSITLGVVKDATCDVASGTIIAGATPDITGVAVNLIRIPILTLTAQENTQVLSLAYPLKLKNASTINGSNTFTVGAMVRSLTVTGFTTSSN